MDWRDWFLQSEHASIAACMPFSHSLVLLIVSTHLRLLRVAIMLGSATDLWGGTETTQAKESKRLL